jgi:rhodanese-related sulfurtransferase
MIMTMTHRATTTTTTSTTTIWYGRLFFHFFVLVQAVATVAAIGAAGAARPSDSTTITNNNNNTNNNNTTNVLQPNQLWEGIQIGKFNIFVDVRTVKEWESGHLENATLAENLAQDGVELPFELIGCSYNNNNNNNNKNIDTCHPPPNIVVYCRSGSRAEQAILRLEQEFGFDSTRLYNGLGVSQWTDAGYPLVTSSLESTDPQCNRTTTEGMTMQSQQRSTLGGLNCTTCCVDLQDDNATTTTTDGDEDKSDKNDEEDKDNSKDEDENGDDDKDDDEDDVDDNDDDQDNSATTDTGSTDDDTIAATAAAAGGSLTTLTAASINGDESIDESSVRVKSSVLFPLVSIVLVCVWMTLTVA